MIKDTIVAFGHENITAKHRTTMEITKEKELSPRGDCIIGVSADKSISELKEAVKERLRRGEKAEIKLVLPDYGVVEILHGWGDSKLTFTHETDVVIRKSRYVCGRTLLISSTKAALDLSREFVDLLRDRKTEIRMIISVGAERGTEAETKRNCRPSEGGKG